MDRSRRSLLTKWELALLATVQNASQALLLGDARLVEEEDR